MADVHDQQLLELCLAKRLLNKETAAKLTQQAEREARPIGDVLIANGIMAKHTVEALRRELKQELSVQNIAGFRIIRRLGQGGMGTVYLAEQTSLRRAVALKVVAPQFAADAQAVDRFMREARTAAAVNHPNIISVIDVGYDQGQLYMALELVTGGDAAQLAERFGGVLPETRALEIIADCCRGLHALYEARLIHRDIKPANIFITKEGVAKLADLGLARSEQGDDRLTVSGHTIGTPAFMSPEQASGKNGIDIRSDLYSLGATLFALITGRPPFTGDGVFAIAAKLLTEPAPDPRTIIPGLSAATCNVIARCLAKSPEERYQSPQDLLAALTAAMAFTTAHGGDRTRLTPLATTGTKIDPPTPATVPPRQPRPGVKRSAGGGGGYLIAMGLAVALVAIVGLLWGLSSSRSTTGRPVPSAAPLAVESPPVSPPTGKEPARNEPTVPTAVKPTPSGTAEPRGPASAMVTNGLVAYWPCDEGAGNRVRDQMGKAPDGMIVNAAWSPGRFGSALSFSPPSKVQFGGISAPSLSAISLSAITVTCWIKTAAPVKLTEPISVIRHDGYFTALQLLPEGNAQLVTWASGHVNPITFPWDGEWNDGRWHHFAVTYHEVQGAQVFKDGKIFASLPKAIGALLPPTAPLVIGGSELDGEYFSGSLDDLRIYDRMLSVREIATLATPAN